MITFRSVTKRFGEDQPALENISFHVEPGEFIFLTGHSGSGKTTLLKILTKEYAPTQGEVEFQGKILGKMRGSQVHNHRRSIGVVFQDYRLLPDLNVWENIALALQIIGKHEREIEERVTDLLQLVQLTDKAYHFPAQLSGGESQRIGIARALATAPSVLLADEPTGNLDPQNTLMIAKLFDRINRLGTTVLFATHDTEVLNALTHRRIILEKGKIISDTGAKSSAKSKEPTKEPAKESPKATPKVQAKAEPKLETPKTEPAPSVESPSKPESRPKKTRFQLPRLSFPFGKKKNAEKELPTKEESAVKSTEAKSTEAEPKPAPAKPETPEPTETVVKPQIKQESLDDDEPVKEPVKKDEPTKKDESSKEEKPKKEKKDKP